MSHSSDGARAVRSDQPAEPALFARLLSPAVGAGSDEESVSGALRRYVTSTAGPYAALVGPLRVRAQAVVDASWVRAVTARRFDEPLDAVVVVATAEDRAASALDTALDVLASQPAIRVVGAELPWARGWQQVASSGVALSVAVPAGSGRDQALEDLLLHSGGRSPLQACLRIDDDGGGSDPAVGLDAVAGFLRRCVDLDLGFSVVGARVPVMTGVLSAELPEKPPPARSNAGPGLLNIVWATRWALNGAEAPEMTALLGRQDPEELVELVSRMSEADVSVLRAFLTTVGCASAALERLGAELHAMGLLEAGAAAKD